MNKRKRIKESNVGKERWRSWKPRQHAEASLSPTEARLAHPCPTRDDSPEIEGLLGVTSVAVAEPAVAGGRAEVGVSGVTELYPAA